MQLTQLVDRQKITDLTIEYAWIIDQGPREKLREIFTDDAVFTIDIRKLNGIDAIINKINTSLGRLSASHHIISNHQVLIRENQASCSCYLHAQHTLRGTEGGDNYIMAGRYIDSLIRHENDWRICERKLVIDWVEGNPKVIGSS
ncbi:MAG: hypothetical protein CL431_02335 [Acidimicrobiaceae bacterium]|jgi:3-phenylpropionate/cinnamic acid dioxygenase small subunit|nr:hypothetical protein [Acidimicrobiaceae bacterium]|tara:strand:+ start:8009 stop:8443 length:435 start_codon:yes stop_codon:yes gene_type:complete